MVIYGNDGVYNAPVWGAKQIIGYLSAVGATALAALAAGFWSATQLK
jgi:hypothetical protein